MREVTLTELRNQAKLFFDLVEAVETARVLRNGRPIADIRPIPLDVLSWKQRQPRPLILSEVKISQMILDERGR